MDSTRLIKLDESILNTRRACICFQILQTVFVDHDKHPRSSASNLCLHYSDFFFQESLYSNGLTSFGGMIDLLNCSKYFGNIRNTNH